MSRAFVREEADERWSAPAPPQEYRILHGQDVVHQTDDLLGALHWLALRPVRGFEVRSRDGQLLALGPE